MYNLKICFLALLKISYGIFTHMLILLTAMVIVTAITGDKCYFSKKLNKLMRGARC